PPRPSHVAAFFGTRTADSTARRARRLRVTARPQCQRRATLDSRLDYRLPPRTRYNDTAMGRKSSAKSQTRSAPPGGEPPQAGKRRFSPLIAVAAILIAAAGGVFFAMRPADTSPAPDPQAAAAAAAAAQKALDEPPPNAKFGPHKQDRLPPLPYDPTPARPPDVVRADYLFAAEHPEILGYMPCYCGCERSGHRGNDDCFVAARASNGD